MQLGYFGMVQVMEIYMNEFIRLVGAKVKQLRKAQGLSQEMLGKKAGFDYRYIGFVEQNRTNPTLKTLGKIADALNVSIPDLMPSLKEQKENHKKLSVVEAERTKLMSVIIKNLAKADNKELETISKLIKLSVKELS